MSRFEELLQALLSGESVDIEPESRIEAIFKNIIEGKGVEGLPEPQSRSEAYLMAVAEKGVGGGETVEKIIQALTITENGTYNVPNGVDGFGPVTVEVPKEEPVIQGLVVTENGTYEAPEGVDGYSKVDVNVPDIPAVTETLTVTENGTYEAPEGVDGYSKVDVEIPIIDVSGVTATAADVMSGKIFVDKDGNQVAGTLVVQTYYHGKDEPSADLGVDGDIYFMEG